MLSSLLTTSPYARRRLRTSAGDLNARKARLWLPATVEHTASYIRQNPVLAFV
jgi:hypothetical protein